MLPPASQWKSLYHEGEAAGSSETLPHTYQTISCSRNPHSSNSPLRKPQKKKKRPQVQNNCENYGFVGLYPEPQLTP
jgi:hypothetical protein